MSLGKWISEDPLKKELTFNEEVDTKIQDVVTQKITKIAIWAITVLLSVVFGGIITSLWDLNGKIHNVIGQESVRGEIEKINLDKIELLKKENSILRAQIAQDQPLSHEAGGAK